ncbi:MAG: DUF2892 domain-containing protein [Proteobacteria bacterium]|nr:DUF2892 domain-containing protein [Pseudomonadota bacterium]
MSKPSGQDKIVRIVAGIFIIISVALGYFHSPYWLLFTVFVGLNLIQSAITGFCPLCKILSALGIRECK